jgi:hypothetical protein
MEDLQLQTMKTAPTTEFEYRRSFLAVTVRILWNAIRLPIVAVLLLLEPVVSFVCGLGLVLGVFACVVFEMSAVGPRFPLIKMLAVSLSFAVILFLYQALLSLFVED